MNIDLKNRRVYTGQDVRKLDHIAINDFNLSGLELMFKAARSAFHMVAKEWTSHRHLVVLCGAGNNAGDGYFLAQIAAERGYKVDVIWLRQPENLSGDALSAWQACKKSSASLQSWPDFQSNPRTLQSDTIIIDALLGTGLNRPVSEAYNAAIQWINCSERPVLALDIPSGLCAETGRVMGASVCANMTCTFIAHKVGCLTNEGQAYCGKIELHTLDLPELIYEQDIQPCAHIIEGHLFRDRIPARSGNSHKGRYGHVLCVGGELGFGGAIALASHACARMGPGLVSVATQTDNVAAVISTRPEVMAHAIDNQNLFLSLAEDCSHIVVGPGLGKTAWSHEIWKAVMQTDKPLIVDADGLNLLAQSPTYRDNWVLTPHPGEAARLLGTTSAAVQSDRLKAVRAIVDRFGGTCVLKGSGTLVHAQGASSTGICLAGNPGMSSGGMGDVLSGFLGGLLAQDLMSTQETIEFAVWLHSTAADVERESYGERGMLATDLIARARSLLNGK